MVCRGIVLNVDIDIIMYDTHCNIENTPNQLGVVSLGPDIPVHRNIGIMQILVTSSTSYTGTVYVTGSLVVESVTNAMCSYNTALLQQFMIRWPYMHTWVLFACSQVVIMCYLHVVRHPARCVLSAWLLLLDYLQ